MKFKIGDKVVVIKDFTGRYPHLVNVISVIDRPSMTGEGWHLKDHPASVWCHEDELKLVSKRKEHNMSTKATLGQMIRKVLKSADERLLIETGFTYESGALTKEGRKVVLDMIFSKDTSLYSSVVEVASKLKEDTCKKKKD